MMKKVIALILAISVSVFGLFGCGEKADFTVGIIQLVEITPLNEAYRGFKEELTKLMKEEGKTVKFDYKNASGDQSAAYTIAETMNAKKLDLVLAIATPAAEAAKEVIKDKPVLFTAVTDAVSAELVASNEEPGGNVSGTSDINPVARQIQLIQELVPGIEKIGVIYNSSEVNSKIQADMAEEECDRLDITLIRQTVAEQTDIETAFNALSAKVEAIFIPTDNMLSESAGSVHDYNKANKKLPIVAGDEAITMQCGIATYGVSYYELGKKTARMAFEILMEDGDISKMPVESLIDDAVFLVNESVAADITFTIPQSILDRVEK